jgi:hypothetical protein
MRSANAEAGRVASRAPIQFGGKPDWARSGLATRWGFSSDFR